MAFEKVASYGKLKIEPLNHPKGWEIFNLPKRIKTASVEKSKDTDLGGLDLTAEIKKHPDNLYVKIYAIKENEVNDNADCFSPEELKKAASTFIGVPIFTNHQNDDVDNSRGECVHAWYDPDEKGVFIIARVDKIAYPKLARGIEEGYVTGTSMGCSVEYSCCSICHNMAHTADEYCSHVKEAKNRKRSGKYDCSYHKSDCEPKGDCPICGCKKGEKKSHNLENEKVFEWNYGLKFIENSFVVNPACHSCGVTCVLHAPEVTKKVAQLKQAMLALQYGLENNPNMFVKAAEAGLVDQPIKTASSESNVKVAGQLELNMLKESLDNCEKVIRSMLAQKDHVDVDYISEVVKAMGQLQDTMDELTEMGYGQLQSPPEVLQAATGQNMQFPKIAAPQQGQQQMAQAPTPQPSSNGESASGGITELPDGIGTVSMPKRSSVINKKKDLAKTSANVRGKLASLTRIVEKIKTANRSATLAETVINVWANPDDNNSYHVLADSQFVTLAQGENVKEVKAIADLPEDIRLAFETDAKTAATNYLQNHSLVKESEQSMADNIKTAQVGSNPESRPEQREVITEKQLQNHAPTLHPRTGKTYEQITESDEQIGRSDDASNDTTSASPQKRLGTYETTTEDQLDKVSDGYIVRAKDAPDVITEKQWDDMSRLVSAKLPGDWLETVTQDQLRKLLSNHTFVGTYETTTEDQLKNQDLGIKRWANKSYVNALTKVAFEALSDTIAKFKKSPEDIKRVVASLTDNPAKMSKAAFLAVVNSLPMKNDERKALVANASYFGKVAGVDNTIGAHDALILSIAENAQAGLKAEDVIETIAYTLRQKQAMAKVQNLVNIKLASTEDGETHIDKFAALSEAFDVLEGVDLRASVEDIGVAYDPTNKKAFVEAARKFVTAQTGLKNFRFVDNKIKVAQDAGLVRMLIDALEQVEQKMNGGGDEFGGDVSVELVGDEGGLEDVAPEAGLDDGMGAELEGIDGALDGPGGTDVVDDLGDPEEENKDMTAMPAAPMGGSMAAPTGAPVMASARTAARQGVVKQAQMMGGQMGGQGGASQAPGAGASLPQPPADAQAPVESFGTDEAGTEEGGEEMGGDMAAKPPGSICPVCGSDDVDIVNGKGKCNNCSSEFVFKVTVDVTKWADLTGDTNDGQPEGDEFGGEGFEMPQEGGAPAPDAGMGAPGAAAGGMPEVPVAAMTRLTPGALQKLAESKIELGSVSPLTGTTNTHKLSSNEWACLDTGCKYRVDYAVEKSASTGKARHAYAQWSWTPPVAQNECPSCERARKTIVKALASANITEAQFDAMLPAQKAQTLLSLKNAGALKQVKTASKNGSVIGDYKKAYGIYGDKFPIESCRQKLANRYGKNALALSGPCEGKPLYECVCNSLKSAGVYSDNIAIKVAYAWSDVDGQEECVTDCVKRQNLALREAVAVCSALKLAVASNEDMLADEMPGDDNNGGGNDGGDNGGGGSDGPPTDVDNGGGLGADNDPFDGNNEESSIETDANGEPMGGGNDVGGAPAGAPPAGGVSDSVTVQIPADVAGALLEEVQKAVTGQPDAAPAGAAPGGNPGAPVDENAGGNDPFDGAADPAVGGGVEEVGGPAELGLDKPMTSVPQQNSGNNEGIGQGKPVSNNQNQQKPQGMGAMAGSDNDLTVQANLDAAAFMTQRVGGVGKAAGLDYSALAARLGVKTAGEKEIKQERVQDSGDIGQYSAGKPASGKTVGQMGHEGDTIRDAELPSVPRSDALMGHESDSINKEEPLPSIPSDKGTMGHESEVGLSGGDVRFTGGLDGVGKTETANANGEILTASDEAMLRGMKGGVNNSKDRLGSLAERIASKLNESKPVSDDSDTKPYGGDSVMGHESKFTADEPTGTEASGNGGMMGHESETLGSTPKTSKDKPEIPGSNNDTKALMGHESDGNIDPEKKLENKGTVIASSGAESKKAQTDEAFRVAVKLLKANVIEDTQLQTKVAQLAQYGVEQIRDYEKAVFAKVASNKRGLTTASEGLERPLIIREASSRKKDANEELVSKLQSLFGMDAKNKLAESNPDFSVRQTYRNGR